MDAGAHWATPARGLAFGAAIQNAGPNVKFEQEGDPLPLTFRGGAAYTLDLRSAGGLKDAAVTFDRFLFTAEAIQVRNEKLAAATGIEMHMPFGSESFGALRFGYLFNRSVDAFSMGIGFKEGRFLLDYALGVKKEVTNTHHFSIGVLF
jgi:hypothetical protein